MGSTRMAPWLLLFFLTPIVEMYLLLRLGSWVGALPTILLVMITAVTGVALLRRQGLSTLTRGMQKLQAGDLPAAEMAEGLLLAVAGALLITPGFVTDLGGFLLLIPGVRHLCVQRLLSQVTFVAQGQPGKPDQGETLEGKFTRRP